MTAQDDSSNAPRAKPARPQQGERANGVVDWDSIHLLYRLGAMSIRQIAANHGITEGAIRQKAAKLGWTRDYAAAVRVQTDKAVMRQEAARAKGGSQGATRPYTQELSTQLNATQAGATDAGAQEPERQLSDRAVIKAAVAIRVDVINYHKGIASRARAIAAELLAQLEARVAETPGEVAKNAITLGALTKAVRDVVETERKVYGIDDARDDEASRPTYTIRREIIDVTPDEPDQS